MKAVLLAAGLGTRLRPLTNSMPKCLVPINGKPLIDFWLNILLSQDDFDEILINLYYFKDLVKQHIDTNWESSNKISLWPEKQLLGTAGTLRGLYSNIVGETLMVVHADNLSHFNLNAFIKAHKTRPKNCAITMMLFETDAPESCGIVELSNDNRLLRMHEKVVNPPGKLANAAVYFFEPEVLEWIEANNALDISKEVIPAFLGRINTWQNRQYHRDIGNPESYAAAQVEFLPYQN